MTKDTTPSAITVSLEWAKKLKEVGWEQGITIGNWRPSTNDFYRKQQQYEIHFTSGIYRNEKSFDAPTAEEILRRLPAAFKTNLLNVGKYTPNDWVVSYFDPANAAAFMPYFNDPSFANAAAAMYCYLAENNLLPSS